MIRYALRCENDHAFDMWFADSDTFDTLARDNHVSCPECASTAIRKAIMAPNVGAKTNKDTAPSLTPREMATKITEFRQKVMAETTDVGDAFAEKARDMHEGLIDHKPIRGQASMDEAKSLVEDGIGIMPIPPEPPKEN